MYGGLVRAIDRHPVVARLVLSLAAATSLVAARAPSAAADPCGGRVACKCGDTVTANYQLTRDLGPCGTHGLSVESKVLLDCGGFSITGLGDGSEQYGIALAGRNDGEVVGATVKNCRVSRFLRGIRVRAGNSNLIADNVAFDNGDHKTHVGYGIDVSGRSRNNLVQNNEVRGNADEGIHIGTGSRDNRFANNVVADNYRENLYLLGADGNAFVGNTLGGGGVNSLYLKDSSRNRFEGNTFRGKPARIIGGSHDNRFVDNAFTGAGLHFTLYRRDARYPYRNRVVGGSITDADPCLRFTSSRENVIEDVALGKCALAVRGESQSGPSEMTVLGAAPAAVVLDDGSTLHVGRKASVQVQDAAGAPVSSAEVQAKDAGGAPLWTATTDDAGTTPPQPFVTATFTGTRKTTRGPITVTATKPGYAPVSVTVPATESGVLTISIRPE